MIHEGTIDQVRDRPSKCSQIRHLQTSPTIICSFVLAVCCSCSIKAMSILSSRAAATEAPAMPAPIIVCHMLDSFPENISPLDFTIKASLHTACHPTITSNALAGDVTTVFS